MRCAVAIFAKTIGLSPVKTRLAADIGTRHAEAFFELSTLCVEATANEAGEAFPETLFPVWAVAEEGGPNHWEKRSFPAIWTGEGNLGARLANVSEHLFELYDAVIFIGTDSPQLDARRLVDAVSRLAAGASNAIAGPAADGGFYLFTSRFPVPREIWEAVTYSSDKTLEDLSYRLKALDWKLDLLPEEQDVDTVADLAKLHVNLKERSDKLSAEQTKLLHWLEENAKLF
ncbi:MAG: TIGR04282 family arsenosugar biosynthesis glycosyltransferase [Pseudomonadota bacterium]